MHHASRAIRLARLWAMETISRMHPIVWIAPVIILIGGFICFVLLPAPLPIRMAVLASDVLAALVIGFVLARRQN